MLYYPHLIRIRPEELHGQFLLTGEERPGPPGWRGENRGRWRLWYADPLPCIRVLGSRGELTGWLLGHVITADGEFLGAASTLILADAADGFGHMVDGLNGRFIGVDLAASEPSIYPDGLGSLAAVYSEAQSTVASTSGLIPPSDATAFDVERILTCDIPYAEAHYPLGLTPRRNVDRLLPNHVLRLDGWRLERRWPLASFGEHLDPGAVVDLVRGSVTQAMRAIRAVYPLNVSLTAGRDSRLMLACARGCMEGSQVFTTDLGDPTSWRDVSVAYDIARRFSLTHQITRGRSRKADLVKWVARTGGETGEPRGWRGARALARQPTGFATVTGVAADIPKLEGWRRNFLTKSISPELVLDYCHVPRIPEFLRRVEDWMAGLLGLSDFEIADLAQIEQSQAAWAAVIEYGELGPSSARLSPMTSADLVRSGLRLPPEYRIERRLHHDVIAQEWPELLEFPINEAAGISPWRSHLHDARVRIKSRLAPGARRWRHLRARHSRPPPGSA